MNAKKLLSLLAVAGIATAFVSTPVVLAEPPADKAPAKQDDTKTKKEKGDKKDKADKADKKDKEKSKDGEKKKAEATAVAAGSDVAAFTLKDTDGKEHSLADLMKDKKAVVLQWFNPDCPFVVKHYGKNSTFNDLQTKYGKDVSIVAVCSNASGKPGSGVDRNAKAKKDWKIEYPILMDEAGTVGKAFNAKNTPLMAIITPDNKIAYYGAIDDDTSASGPGKTNYVAKALDEILAGTTVTTQNTKPYGCSVHYAN